VAKQLGTEQFRHRHDTELPEERISRQLHKYFVCRAASQLGAQQFRYRHDRGLPEEVDWRKAGIVGPIKNQHKGGAPVRASYCIVFHFAFHCANSALLRPDDSPCTQQRRQCTSREPLPARHPWTAKTIPK